MKDLIAYLAGSLAGRPEDVRVTESPGEKGTTLELTVADEDLNHLIGKQGRTVKAMRSLLAAASAKSGRRCFLTIAAEAAGTMEAEGVAEDDDSLSGDEEAIS